MDQQAEPVEVVAGLIPDQSGRILLAQRPPGKYMAGRWEFPGGKREPGESRVDALRRELDEELGIALAEAEPCLTLRHDYPKISVLLHLFFINRHAGQPAGREGQALRWVTLAEMSNLPMLAADRPIIKVLGLDSRYAITPDPERVGGADGVLQWTSAALARGHRLFQLRAKSLDASSLAQLAEKYSGLMDRHGAHWLLNGSADDALALGADGVHLDSRRLADVASRPLPERFLTAASCHNQAELAQAGHIGLDFVTLSPVSPTASHPGAATLGWRGLGDLCRQSPLPVYALGGMQPDDIESASRHGAYGVAGIRAFGGNV